MLKFFRNIRKRNLTDNRIGKYLLYAIGEIVLVVIGILIALNLNNRNEQRKKEAEVEIININKISSFEPYFKDRLAIKLTKNNTILYTSNKRAAQFREWLTTAVK